MEQME
jgi:hypothetical protein